MERLDIEHIGLAIRQIGLNPADNEYLAACPCPHVAKHISCYVKINDAINLRTEWRSKNYWITVRSAYIRTFYFFIKIFFKTMWPFKDKLSVLISGGCHKERLSEFYKSAWVHNLYIKIRFLYFFNTVREYWKRCFECSSLTVVSVFKFSSKRQSHGWPSPFPWEAAVLRQWRKTSQGRKLWSLTPKQ